MRINRMISKGKNALICEQILSADKLRKCMELIVENLCADIVAWLQGATVTCLVLTLFSLSCLCRALTIDGI